MMHGRVGSDSAIKAKKPSNNAELSTAETGDPRAGTKRPHPILRVDALEPRVPPM